MLVRFAPFARHCQRRHLHKTGFRLRSCLCPFDKCLRVQSVRIRVRLSLKGNAFSAVLPILQPHGFFFFAELHFLFLRIFIVFRKFSSVLLSRARCGSFDGYKKSGSLAKAAFTSLILAISGASHWY